VLGWTEEEVVSMSIFDLLHPEDLEHTRAGFELTGFGGPKRASSVRRRSVMSIPLDENRGDIARAVRRLRR
jgi:PAS domain S-box-containing protein